MDRGPRERVSGVRLGVEVIASGPGRVRRWPRGAGRGPVGFGQGLACGPRAGGVGSTGGFRQLVGWGSVSSRGHRTVPYRAGRGGVGQGAGWLLEGPRAGGCRPTSCINSAPEFRIGGQGLAVRAARGGVSSISPPRKNAPAGRPGAKSRRSGGGFDAFARWVTLRVCSASAASPSSSQRQPA